MAAPEPGHARILHNPRCSKSRAALARLEEAGLEVEVVRYLDAPPSVDELRELISAAGLTPRQAVRTGEPEYAELGLAAVDDETLLAALVTHPRLLERPLVTTAQGTRMARPTEALEEIL